MLRFSLPDGPLIVAWTRAVIPELGSIELPAPLSTHKVWNATSVVGQRLPAVAGGATLEVMLTQSPVFLRPTESKHV